MIRYIIYTQSSLNAKEMDSRVDELEGGPGKVLHRSISVKRGLKRVYFRRVSRAFVNLVSNTLFEDIHWVFQQDSAPAHNTR